MNERHYQEKQIERMSIELSVHRKVLLQSPTGGGKTVMFAKIAQAYSRASNKSVLILVHRVELLKQASRTIKRVMDTDPYLITSETKKYRYARIYIGMVDSVLSRMDMFSDVGLVIIDECHIANFNKMHSVFLEENIIGVTATPISSSKKTPICKFYESIVVGPQIQELISLGFLAQNITRCPADIVDITKFQIDKLKGDYNEKQMYNEYKLPHHVTNVVKNYHKYCFGRKTIIFNVNVEHSKEVNECFVACGFNSRHLDASSTDREDIFHWFKTTKDAVLNSVMIPTTGFDEPSVQAVITNFSTLSLTKALQCWGRGGRIIDDSFIEHFQHEYPYPLEKKDSFIIIDMGGNCVKFGDWNDDRDWEHIFYNPEVAGNGIAPVKTCPECEGLVHAATRICTCRTADGELCLHEFRTKPRMQESDIEEMILITKGIRINEVVEKSSKKYEYYPMFEIATAIVENMYNKYGRNITEYIAQKCFREYYTLCIDWYKATIAKDESRIQDISDSGWHIRLAKNNFNSLLKNKYGINLELNKNEYDWNNI